MTTTLAVADHVASQAGVPLYIATPPTPSAVPAGGVAACGHTPPRRRPTVVVLHGTGQCASSGVVAEVVGRLAADGNDDSHREYPFIYDTAADLSAVADYLISRADVDGARLGVTGISLGGMTAWYAAAADTRWAAVAPLIAVQSWAAAVAEGVLGLIAPRPLLVLNGAADPRCPPAGVAAAWRTVAATYAVRGGDATLVMEAGVGHAVTPAMWDRVFAWFGRVLRVDAPSPAADGAPTEGGGGRAAGMAAAADFAPARGATGGTAAFAAALSPAAFLRASPPGAYSVVVTTGGRTTFPHLAAHAARVRDSHAALAAAAAAVAADDADAYAEGGKAAVADLSPAGLAAALSAAVGTLPPPPLPPPPGSALTGPFPAASDVADVAAGRVDGLWLTSVAKLLVPVGRLERGAELGGGGMSVPHTPATVAVGDALRRAVVDALCRREDEGV
ncbi:hypothetical protein I4F81_006076 [Pyropia yezoensis]|uniref:Uncharacterized protein n=1 Tax=Pyropia yezoensis TaxID=2788 RepID=A0ACC3BZR3_PYRYE|nr:hypothetical protein I4F81_006076 [Neopyropia yezoensis]